MPMRGYPLRQGDWKILLEEPPWGTGNWQLYNLASDPSEQQDLATNQPDRLAKLQGLFDDYVRESGVVDPRRFAPNPSH